MEEQQSPRNLAYTGIRSTWNDEGEIGFAVGVTLIASTGFLARSELVTPSIAGSDQRPRASNLRRPSPQVLRRLLKLMR